MASNSECCDALIVVLQRARELLAMPDNNFLWSSWEDSAIALAELDGYLSELKLGQLPPLAQLEILFLPTGPIQEVSISSGWGEKFLVLASDFDNAVTGCH